MKSALAAVACVLVAGCASMNRNECLSANWYAVGLRTARAGSRSSASARTVAPAPSMPSRPMPSAMSRDATKD